MSDDRRVWPLVAASGGPNDPVSPAPPSRVSDRHRRLRQAWPLIVSASVLAAVLALALVLAVTVLDRRDALVGHWRTDSGTPLTIRRSGDAYELKIGEDPDWIAAQRIVGPLGSLTLLASVPPDPMAVLSAGSVRSAAEIEIGADEDGTMRIASAATRVTPAEDLGELSRSKGALDWIALAAVVVAAFGLAATVIVGRMVGIGAGDPLVPGLAVACAVGALVVMAGLTIVLAVLIPLMLLSWYLILTRWFFRAVPDVGLGLRALFTRRGRRAFREGIASQDDQSDRGDALEAVVDEVRAERGIVDDEGAAS